MKKDIFGNLTENEIEFLKILSYRLNTQNQRCTAYPIWKVCDIERRYGVSDNIADGYCIIDTNTEEVYLDCEDIIKKIVIKERDKIESGFRGINEIISMYDVEVNIHSLRSIFDFIVCVLGWEGYSYCGYIESLNTKAIFITEKEAEEYLENNRYKYSSDAYIYVDSAYGNLEIMMLIDILKKLKS